MPVRILTAHELAASLNSEREPLVIDARARVEYLEGHLPGAVWMGWEDWCDPPPPQAPDALRAPGFWGALARRNAEWYAKRLGAAGIDRARTIAVYANGPASRGREARIAWMLLYLGADDVRLLDGGWPAWLEAGGAQRTDEPEPLNARFEVSFREERRARCSDLVGAGGSLCVVDTRSRREFVGLDYEYMPRRGRLPEAVHIPFTDLFVPGGRYIGGAEYRDVIRPRIGSHARPIAYCEVGVRACALALLHEVYTDETIAVYDGSFMEWSLDPDLPVEAGEK